MPRALVFSRIYLTRPIEAPAVVRLLTRLAASDVSRPIVFETWASDNGLEYIVGSTDTAVHELKRHIRAALPGVEFSRAERGHVTSAGRISTEGTDLPMAGIDPEHVSRDLYAALNSRSTGETLVIQTVLTGKHAPRAVAQEAVDPTQSFPSRLLRGALPIRADVRRRLSAHAASARLGVVVRIGVASPDAGRRARLARGVFGSVQALEAPGARLHLVCDRATRVQSASLGRGLILTAAELAPLLGWPLGSEELAGADPLHPKRIRVPKSVSEAESVFAVGTTPGPERRIGLTPVERLSHLGVLSPTGSGKSESVLAPLLLSDVAAGRPVVLVDPKAQLVDFVLDRLPEAASERVVLFDPSDPDGTAGFNPLDIGDRDPYVVVDSIMAVLRAVFTDGWGPRTEDILHASLLPLALDGRQREEPHTLLDVPRLLTEPAFRRSVIGSVASEPVLASFWAKFDDMAPGHRETVIAAPMNKLRRYLMRRGVVAVLGQPRPTFRLRDVFQTDRIVLVALNDALVGPITSQLIGGLICAEVFSAAQERAREKNPKVRPGMVFVDEVASFLHLPLPISTALEVSRSYGVGWHLFGQGRYQLSPSLAQAFDINTRSKLTFATTPTEAKELVKSAPMLTVDDVQSLPKFEIYANLLTRDGPSGWFSAKTLPPPERLSHGGKLRREARARRVNEPAPASTGAVPATPPDVGHVRRRRA